jgi:hypothetical protein
VSSGSVDDVGRSRLRESGSREDLGEVKGGKGVLSGGRETWKKARKEQLVLRAEEGKQRTLRRAGKRKKRKQDAPQYETSSGVQKRISQEGERTSMTRE